ncbi:MAG: hypothetical protein F4Z17_00270 [Acidimicrobiia bacterium]|nr:hypothetical protein [Acidimicrobiia bacterium]
MSTRSILGDVPTNLQGEVPRSLWRRIDSEFTSGGSGAVTSYLRSQFEEIATRLHDELEVATDADWG